MRIIFMGTPHFAVPTLEALIRSGYEVAAVYCQPPRPAGRGMKLSPSPIQQLAEQHGIPVRTPTSLKSPEAQAEFAAYDADVAIVAAYGLLLPQAILDAPRLGCLNIHPSDLPRWRGAAPLQRTLMAGDTATACCIMQMDAGLDTGAVLAREPFAIPPAMNVSELHNAMAALGAKMVLEVLERIDAGDAPAPRPQSAEGATYAAKLTRADRLLDFNRPAAELLNQLRGITPVPGAVLAIHGEDVKLLGAEAAPGDPSTPTGTTLDEALTINCAGGTALRPTLLQRPGKKPQPAAEILHAWPVAAHTQLA